MIVKLLLTQLIYLTATFCVAQSITLKGKIVSESESSPISFASIFLVDKLSNSIIGTLSDYSGDFTLHLPGKYCNDTVQVTCIGYDQFRIPVRNISAKKSIKLRLKESVTYLQTVIIRDLSAKEMVVKCIDAIDKNYFNVSVFSKGFYWQSFKENGMVTRLETAKFSMLENNSNRVSRKIKTTYPTPTDSTEILLFLEKPENLFYLDLIRHRAGFIKTGEVDEWVFTYDTKTSLPDNYVQINVSRLDKTAALTLLLNEKTLAFETIDYVYHWNPSTYHTLNDSSLYQIERLEGKVLYKRNLSKYALHCFSNSFTYKVVDRKSRKVTLQRKVTNEFNVVCSQERRFDSALEAEDWPDQNVCSEEVVIDKKNFCEAATALGLQKISCE